MHCIASHTLEHTVIAVCLTRVESDQKWWSHGLADPFFSFQVASVDQKNISASMAEQACEQMDHHAPLQEFTDVLSGEDSIDGYGAGSSEVHICRLNMSQGADKASPISKAAEKYSLLLPEFGGHSQFILLQPSVSHNLLSLIGFFHYQKKFGNTTQARCICHMFAFRW